MNILIINTERDETANSHMVTKQDDDFTMGLYRKYREQFGISANHMWDKYTIINGGYIGTFRTMDKLMSKTPIFINDVVIVSVKDWLRLDCENKQI